MVRLKKAKLFLRFIIKIYTQYFKILPLTPALSQRARGEGDLVVALKS